MPPSGSNFPEILRQERFRANAFAGSAAFFFLAPIVATLLLAPDWSWLAAGVVAGLLLGIVAALIARASIRVLCPLCNNGRLQERYYDDHGVRKVAHHCLSCAAKFDNGTLVNDND